MIRTKYIDMQTFLREKIQDVSIAKKATSVALGIAIARMLPMPTTMVDEADNHYQMTLRFNAIMLANDFNESIVVDTDLVAETTRSYWLIRYTCAYPNLNAPMLPIGNFGFVSKINNVGRYINQDIYKFCDENSELMVVLVNRIQRLLNDKEVN